MKRYAEEQARPEGPAARSPVGRRWFIGALAAVPALAVAVPLAEAAASEEGAPSGDEVGSIWWNELQVKDTERARAFYAKVAGWTSNTTALDDASRPPAQGESEYTTFTSKGREMAGATKIEEAEGEEREPRWVPYIQVANVDAAARLAEEMGGKIIEPAFDLAKVGRMALMEDPEGVPFGLVTPRTGGR